MTNNNNNQQVSMNIDLSKLENVTCKQCNSTEFLPIQQMRAVPALLSPNGQAGLAITQVGFHCMRCDACYNMQFGLVTEEVEVTKG